MSLDANELIALSKLTNAQRGQLAELIFLRKASSLGFSIAKPWAEGERYDSIVRMQSLMLRVQVKSVLNKKRGRPSYRLQIAAKRRPSDGQSRHYNPGEIDFLAGYIFAEDLWYIFPASVVLGKKSVTLYPGSERSQFEKYREAWDQMKPAAPEAVPEKVLAAAAGS